MAILGAALVPLIQGILADIISLHASFIIPFLCYIYIMFYGFYSPKWKSKNKEIVKPKVGFH